MNLSLTSVMIGFLGLAVSLAAFFLAWKMTQGKPTARVAALIGAVSVSLLTAAVTREFMRELEKQAVRPVDQPTK